MINNFNLLRETLRGGAALPALALLGAGAGLVAFAAPAAAQDYTSGALSGTVTDDSGAPVAGATVTVRSQAQGQTRTFTTSSSGGFSAVGLTPGVYDVSVTSAGNRPTTGTVTIVAAREARLTLGVVSETASSDIVVTGQRVRQDFTQTTTGVNLDVPATTANVPLARSVTALTLLAPGAVRGVAGFGDVAAVGGSSVAENAYYINGLNITNPDTYVGGANVPFDLYKTLDVQTGGYAAEFGRATGSVINATTKSGSNEAFGAVHGNFTAAALGERAGDIGVPGSLSSVGALSRADNLSMTIEGGGAIIKDHLFYYGLLQTNHVTTESASQSNGTFTRTLRTDPFFAGKLDAYITSTQHLEFTYFNTTSHTKTTGYGYARTNATDPNSYTIRGITGIQDTKTGGENYVGRYTGSITDFFQISGAYGVSKDNNTVLPTSPDSYYVRDQRSGTSPNGTTAARTISLGQPFATNQVISTERKFFRADGDLRFEMAGRHHIRFGFDQENLSMVKTTRLNGALPIRYTYTNSGVQLLYENLGGAVSGKDRAYYLQDSWEPITGLTINLGVRDDEFEQTNLSGQRYLSLKNNWAPRVGFSYVPGGDSIFKIQGSYGRYFIPPAMNLGFRGRDLYFAEYFSYPGGNNAAGAAAFPTDPVTGLPLINLGAAQTTRAGSGYGAACPAGLAGAPGNPISSGATCLVLGDGSQDPAYAKVAPGTGASREDEYIFGVRAQLTDLISVGLTGTHRKLGRVSEDTDFAPYLYDYYNCGTAAPTGTAAQCDKYGNASTYYIWNPGKSVTLVDWLDPSKRVNLTGLPFPVPRRTYDALTFEWHRADDGKWNWNGSVTASRLAGSTEGTVKSDAGNNAQTDAGSTQDYDYAGLSDYSYGVLPNDHTWVIKTWGAYHFGDLFTLGANVLLQSGMHGSCQGIHPTDPYAAGYGASSFYCGYGTLNAAGNYTQSQPARRGTGFTTPWMKQVDLSARINLPVGLKGFVLRADVFNVFNDKTTLQRYQVHESAAADGSLVPDPLYLSPTVLQAPRSIRLGFDLAF